MRTIISIILGLAVTLTLAGCDPEEKTTSAQKEEAAAVDRQQSQYSKGQPIPAFDYSLERDLLIQLYKIRNQKVTTHSVWRGNTSVIEGDCPSMGFGLPYDTSLTNPLVGQEIKTDWTSSGGKNPAVAIGQPEPNGVFASTNTSATWVFCVNKAGLIEPTYVEAKVTAYSGPVKIDYEKNRVVRIGKSNVTLKR